MMENVRMVIDHRRSAPAISKSGLPELKYSIYYFATTMFHFDVICRSLGHWLLCNRSHDGMLPANVDINCRNCLGEPQSIC